MSNLLYCPIIKGKVNDIKAMAYVSHSLAVRAKPVFELPLFKPTDDIEKILARFATRLAKLNGPRPCYVDFPLLRPGLTVEAGDPVLQVAYGHLNALGVPFEPTYGFDRDMAAWPLVASQAQRSGGLLLRLDADDLETPDDTVDGIVDLAARGIDLRRLDVLIDHRSLPDSAAAAAVASETADFIDLLARHVPVRRVIIAASCAPKTMALIPRDSHRSIERSELVLWATVVTERLPVAPIYADYGVIHPDFTDLTPSPHINGKIRYTHGRELHIYRGHSLRQEDRYEQYRGLATEVARSSYYQGSSFSYGDRYIQDCATGHAGTGNPGTWVLVDQNHHLTYAIQQQAALRSLAAAGSNAQRLLAQA